MGKYGKRSRISDDISTISFCLLGEAGVGKTSTMAKLCEDEFGPDGYIILDMGKEQGMEALDDYTYETCENWKKFDAVVKDIVQNKDTDYPNLKVVVIDTLDQAVEIATPEVIRRWNIENQSKKGFEAAKTLNGSWGGFGKGDDKLVEIILDKIWELKKAGVNTYFCGHVKMRSKIDPLTQEEYSVLSTDIAQRVFEGFKTKMHVIGIACIDRTISVESTGRKNIVNHKDITINKVKEEKRKIVFRDDSYSVDSKSRYAGIADECELSAEALVRTLKDAIKNSKREHLAVDIPSKNKVAKPEPVEEVEDEPVDLPFDEDEPEVEEDVEIESDYPEDLETVIREMFKACKDPEIKKNVRGIIKEHGGNLVDVDEDGLKKLYDILK